MREIFVAELAKEILGPRAGINETFATRESPLNEYITGVLAPKSLLSTRDVEADSELPVTDESSEEEFSSEEVNGPPSLSPALDPKSRPPSMGISFLVEAATPKISVCVTWARYQGSFTKGWQRSPRFFIREIVADRDRRILIGGGNQEVTEISAAELSFHIQARSLSTKRFLIRLTVVNEIAPSVKDTLVQIRPDFHIFQPEIRVCEGEGTRIVPSFGREYVHNTSASLSYEQEEAKLAYLYRQRPIMARGHLCSATWQNIDPQQKFSGKLTYPDTANQPPFHWIDGELLSPEQREKFSSSKVRTEFMPVYNVAQPDLSWREDFGTTPELSPKELSELWNTSKLKASLEPLSAGYSRWIAGLKSATTSANNLHSELLNKCQEAQQRIEAGIRLLCTNEDARLSFCFANRAIYQQSDWSGQSLRWRPFQLAFFLMNIESVVNPDSKFRSTCDLLWVPTGTGKTEAYLAIIAFTIAYRRRINLRKGTGDKTGAGVSVITRYTLRLLTIQQFRRLLSTITACEYLRVVSSGPDRAGWTPSESPSDDNLLWGSTPFTIGLWVGGGVTPNKLRDTGWGFNQTNGALSILDGRGHGSEPAQVLSCPACHSVLAIPEMGLSQEDRQLYFVIRSNSSFDASSLIGTYRNIRVENASLVPDAHVATNYVTLAISFTATRNVLPSDVESLWREFRTRIQGLELACVRPSRPGYFFRTYQKSDTKHTLEKYDFEIICPNPRCPLRKPWKGGSPSGLINGRRPQVPDEVPDFEDGNRSIEVNEAFRTVDQKNSDRIPIPAFTVDEQIYNRLPSVVVATVDKFARPSFEPRGAALFGNVSHCHSIWGYYRPFQHCSPQDIDGHPGPVGTQQGSRYYMSVLPPNPPDLILQDELHLLEGPLGSLVGFYETAIEYLTQEVTRQIPKYIASTATVSRADDQVKSVFLRDLQIFPPLGLDADDRFFVREFEIPPLDDTRAGRLYVGVAAPGRGPLTPIVRIWSRLLQTAWNNRNNPLIDPFWTMTGYFNAIRELAGARALYRQDIPQRLQFISGNSARPTPEDGVQELSSRTNSTDLPSVLNLLNQTYPNACDALFTTAMFGTGVDIPRMGMMVVNGQPKTTSSYIQSTGRVGRKDGALVVTFLRASRPRDLNHYEFFAGYHRQLHRFVEPVTVFPFAPGVVNRAGGPVVTFILRNMRRTTVAWNRDGTASQMSTSRTVAPEITRILDNIEERAGKQPHPELSNRVQVRSRIVELLDKWMGIARRIQSPDSLVYSEYSKPSHSVVLGDPPHQHSDYDVVYENAPQSLRDIEETTSFEV